MTLVNTPRPTLKGLAKMIDHSLLHPTLTDAAVREGCQLCLDYHVASACVKPCHVDIARVVLAGSDVLVCAVIGFPHGNSTVGIKVIEAESAVAGGAAEIDMVVNLGKVKGGDWTFVEREIQLVNETVTGAGAILKVIFETDYLQKPEIIRLCQICSRVGVAFVKTSTGYGFVKGDDGRYSYEGATLANLRLMREHSGANVQIKAAGGVRTLDNLLEVARLGVTRVGATATRQILDEAAQRGF